MRRRRFDRTLPTDTGPRVNHQIRVPRILLIDEEGQKLGEFMTADALDLARSKGLDLVEVAPNARPPVCRIQDFGRLKYATKKREAQARKKQVQVQLKEVKVRPKTDIHDFEVKVRHARRFLEAGDKVKVTVRFRGREHAHHDIGADRCLRLAGEVKDLAKIEAHPRMDGRQMFMILAPIVKKRDLSASAEPADPRVEAASESAD